jgi:hypothetical protein
MASPDRRAPLQVVRSRGGVGARLVAAEAIRARSSFFKISRPRYVERPTYQTVQVGFARHALSLGVLTFINHSCHPNVIVDTSRMVCWATRDIAKGEELSYFYPSTEWVMARPFLCLCGAANCIRIVAGARQLSTDVLARYFINEHIRAMIGDELTAASRAWMRRLSAPEPPPRGPRRSSAHR